MKSFGNFDDGASRIGNGAGRETRDMMEPTETNRDRVRRLLLDPLGFRHPKKLTEAEGRARLDAIADQLAYMRDDTLAALARMLRVHGQGADRSFWPERATFVAFAHLCQPLPLERDPKLLSWFASVEGERMVQDGTLVETWRYFEARRVPPYTPQARGMVLEAAQRAATRIQIVDEKLAAGYVVLPDDLAFARSYRAETDRLRALLAEARARRGERGAA